MNRFADRVSEISPFRHSLPCRLLAMFLTVALTMQPLAASAQVVAAANALSGTRPTIDTAGNGTPVVQITAPNGVGVSRNQYQQYNVDSRGVILNNSSGSVQTQQAGWIAGNPNLAGTGARVILNEVTGNLPSNLAGFTEVAGQRAEVVIANPSGITCNGCGFINTSRGILTTGTPVFGGSGSLDAFRVTGGQIAIGANGLNGNNLDQLDLIARSIVVNGQVWGNNLNVVTGSNQVSYNDLSSTPIAGSGAAPANGIDVALVGGMYANKIRLVSTESGVGVNSQGALAAQGGNFSLDAQGRITLGGTLQASGRIDIAGSRDVATSGTIYSQQSATIAAGGQIANTGVIAAQGDLTLNSASLQSTGTLGAGIDAAGNATQAGRLAVTTSGVLQASGQNLAGASLAFSGNSINLAGAQTTATGDITLTAAGDIDHGNGTAQSGGLLTLNAGGAITNDRGSLAGQTINSQSASFSNQGGQIVQAGSADARIATNGLFDNRGGVLVSNGKTIVTVGSLDNRGGAVQTNGADLGLTAGGRVDNSSNGQIAASGNTQIVAAELVNQQARITAGQNLSLSTTQAIDNRTGTIAASGDVDLRASQIDNSQGMIGAVQGKTTVVANTGSVVNNAGRIEAAQRVDVTVRGLSNTAGGAIVGADVGLDSGGQALDNSGGKIAAQGTLDIQSGALTNNAGLVQANGALAINTHGQVLSNINSGGDKGIVGQGAVTVVAGNVGNQAGYIGAGGTLNLSGASVTNSGLLVSQSDVALTAATFNNQGGQVQAPGNITVNAGSLNNAGSLIRSGSLLNIIATGVANTGTQGIGQGLEGANVSIAANQIDNTQGAIRADQSTNLTSGGTLNNSQGLVSAGVNLNIADVNPGAKTLAITNTGGMLIAGSNLTVDSARLTGDGKVLSQGDISVKVDADYTHTGQFQANGNATLETKGTLTNQASLLAGRVLNLKAVTLDNRAAGQILAPTLNLIATGSHTLTNRGLIDGINTIIQSIAVNNLGTGRIYGDQVSIAATTLTNEPENGVAPVIAARNRLDIGAATISNKDSALIYSAGDMAIGGSLDAANHATGQAGTLTNSSATLQADGNLALNVDQIYNQRSQFAVAQQAGSDQAVYGILVYSPGGPWALFKATLAIDSNTVVTADSGAGRILAGGDLRFNGTVNNDKSDILAGGNISFNQGSYNAIGQQGQTTRFETGISIFCISCANGKTYGENHPGLQQFDLDSIRSVITQDLLRKWAASGYVPADVPTGQLDWRIQSGLRIDPYTVGSSVVGNYDLAPARLTANQSISGNLVSINNLNVGGLIVAPSATGQANVRVAPGTDPGRLVSVPTINGSGLIGTVAPNLTLPGNSLFRTYAHPSTNYYVETDPRFANYRTWLSSDFMLQALGFDPNAVEKRLGDGFYEQKLISEQVLQLTGRRFLGNYASNEDQYRALMTAGTTVAQSLKLVPGIALTGEQMAQLTSDIVWLVEKTITLPDGSTAKTLVPQLYVNLKNGELSESGALIAAKDINLNLAGDLNNAGTISGRNSIALAAGNINNLTGRIAGADVSLAARTDLNNLGGQIVATNNLGVSAGRDLNLTSTTVDQREGNQIFNRTSTSIDRVAGLYVTNPGGTLTAVAGRDLNLQASEVVNTGSGGQTALVAARNLNLGTLTTKQSQNVDLDANNYDHARATQEVGSSLRTQGNLTLVAGQDLSVRASAVSSGQGAIALQAGRDVLITNGVATVDREQASKDVSGKATTITHDALSQTTAVTSTVSGDTVAVQATNTLYTQGATLRASKDISLQGQEIVLDAATENRSSQSSISKVGKSASARQKQAQSESSVAVGTIIDAGGNLSIVSQGSTTVVGGALAAGDSLRVTTGGDLNLLASQSQSAQQINDYNRGRKKATTLAYSDSEVRQILTTITVGNGLALDVGGNFSADIGARDADGRLLADRMTTSGIVQGAARQQVSVTRTGDAGGSPNQSEVRGDLKAQGIETGKNDSFAPLEAITGQNAAAQYLQSGLVQIKNNPQLQARLQNILGNTQGTQLTYKDSSGKLSLTVAGQAKVQEVFNTLKLTETFDVKKFADAQTAQIVTLVVAIALTVCTGGMGGAAIGMALGAQGTAAVMINAAVIAMSSTMVGQLAGGGSFEKSFNAGLKAGATSALMAGVASGIDQFVNGGASTTTAIDSGKQVVQSGTNAASTGLSKLDAMMTTNYWEQTALNAAAKGVLAKTQGGSFKDGFAASVVGSLGASGAGIIGDNTSTLPLTNIVAHAALGCVTAAAGKQDCGAGALGGAASASLARVIDLGLQDTELSKTTQDTIIASGAVVGSMAVAKALGKDVITAGNAAGNEVLNNYLTPKQLGGVEQAMAKCAGNTLCQAQVRDSARVVSASQDVDLTVAKLSCFLGFCERYDQIVATLKPLYDPAQVVKDVATLHPDWTKAQVANQAIAYLTEAQKSLDAATWRTVFGTIETAAAVASAVGPAVSALRGAKGLATETNEAVFWSGLGQGGAESAAAWAAKNGGATLESTLASRGIALPVWDASNPSVVAAWRQASIDFAAGAQGNVRVLQGDFLRSGAIWRDEFAALKANPNVTSIRSINPSTGVEILLWKR